MENKTVYLDQRFNPNLTGHFFLLYWLFPAICVIGIPFALHALAYQIPFEISVYGPSKKLIVIIVFISLALVLAFHALVALVTQALKDFPALIASIMVDKNGALTITPFVGNPKLYAPEVLVEPTCEPCNDPFWLRIYRYSTYKYKYTCRLKVDNDVWLICKPTMDSQETIAKIRSMKTQAN